MSATGLLQAVTWCVHPLVNLHWRRWNDEWAVFDVGSGQTHQMDTLTAVALLLLEAAPASTRQLAVRIADELEVEDGPALASALVDLLDRLATAGLIEFA